MSSGIFGTAAAILGLLCLIIMGRVIVGPTMMDRAVALDAINTLVVAIMILLGAYYNSVIMIDISIVYAALSFLGTLFIARYQEGGL